MNNKAWRPSRESSLASGVSLCPRLFLFFYLSLSALSLYSPHSPTLSFLEYLFPVEHPIFNLLSTVSLPHCRALSTRPVSFSPAPAEAGGGLHRRDKTSKSRTFIYPRGVTLHRGASCRCRMSRHSKGLALRMWVI